MRTVVLVTAGSFGDLFPTLGLALGLKARGHRPIVATSLHYRGIVERDGLEFHAVRPDLDPSDEALLARVMDPVRGSEVVVRELAVPAVRDSYEDLLPVVRRADLVLSHPIAFATPIVATVAGVPWLSTVLAPIAFFSAYDFPALQPVPAMTAVTRLGPWAGRLMRGLAKSMTKAWVRPVQDFRAELGLPRGDNPLYEGQFSPYGTLALYSKVLSAPQPDWPPRTHVTGFVFYASHGALSADLERFLAAGDPPIVFTLGSSAVGAAGSFYTESLAAAERLGRRAVLLIGRHEANRPPAPLPAGTIAAEYVPHELLFPRAAAIVHHGGVGTTAQALRAGRPMLVVPHAHDQPDNGARVARLGAGRVLDVRRYRADRAAAHLDALLRKPSYAVRAAAIGEVVRAEDGVRAACDVIDDVLAGRRQRPGGAVA